MSVFKKYNGKQIKAKHPAYATARWWVYRRVKGHKTIHQVIPTARTKEEAELAERQRVAVEVVEVLNELEENADVGVIVITGSSRAFAAGADISEMADKTFVDMYGDDMFSIWDEARTIKKPIVAAVSVFALGGGCELALLCDFAVAAEDAKFGLPEIKLGIIPGIGGTQRLTRAVGKALAMDMILTGRTIDAREAMQPGLISRIFPSSDVITGAIEAARILQVTMGLPWLWPRSR